MDKNKKRYLITAIALVISFVALFFLSLHSRNQSDKIKEQTGLISSLNAELKTWKDEDGNHAKTEPIITRDPKDFLAIQNLTGENKKLQETVAKYKKQLKNGGSVTNIVGNTNVSTKAPTTVTTEDKTDDKGVVTQRPVYRSKFDLNGWVVGSTKAAADSTEIDLKIRNEYTVVIGEDNDTFLKLGKGKPFVEVTNVNPYSETSVVKTYSVDVSKKKNNLWIYTGVAGVIAGILIMK